jgi:hypothetical protein
LSMQLPVSRITQIGIPAQLRNTLDFRFLFAYSVAR